MFLGFLNGSFKGSFKASVGSFKASSSKSSIVYNGSSTWGTRFPHYQPAISNHDTAPGTDFVNNDNPIPREHTKHVEFKVLSDAGVNWYTTPRKPRQMFRSA